MCFPPSFLKGHPVMMESATTAPVIPHNCPGMIQHHRCYRWINTVIFMSYLKVTQEDTQDILIPFWKEIQIKLKSALNRKINQRSAMSSDRHDFVTFHETFISTQEARIRCLIFLHEKATGKVSRRPPTCI